MTRPRKQDPSLLPLPDAVPSSRTFGNTETVEADDRAPQARKKVWPYLVHAFDRQRMQARPELAVPLAEGTLTVGRGRSDELSGVGPARRLTLRDRTVSRDHAAVEVSGDGAAARVMLRDLGSHNGSLVNGERVADAELRPGDWLMLGAHVFVYRHVPLGWLAWHREGSGDREVLGQSLVVQALGSQLERIAPTQVPVLLQGDTGVGKEVVARQLHRLSGRRGAFVGVNCGAIPEQLIESELFGHVRGAFSGAVQAKSGLFVAADRGTLLLDEVGDMPASVQVRLLRVLQEGEVLAVGATESRKIDVRVVAASHRDLQAMTSTGGFREDLFARLRGLRIVVPGLADRREDIGLLFAEGLRRSGKDPSTVRMSAEATAALFACDWPHNVRQLMQVASVAAALVDNDSIERRHLEGLDLPRVTRVLEPSTPPSAPPPPADTASAVVLAAKQRKQNPREFAQRLEALMNEEGGNVRVIAERTGFSRMQIYRWLKETGLKV